MAEIHETVMQRRVRHEARSPGAAAFAGIAYAILISFGMLQTYNLALVDPVSLTPEWLQGVSGTARQVIAIVPFAGIAFLWFTGVVRDQLSYQEGRFFSTLFFGSGIIQIVLLFIWSAIFGAIIGTRNLIASGMASGEVHIFGFVLMNELIGNYALRMSGIYMTAIAALWGRTGTMPRWLIVLTYVLAVGFLFAADRFRESRFLFPGWVFVVSVYILILNYRRKNEHPGLEMPPEAG